MRRIALLALTLSLSGCGYNTWWNPPFIGAYSPNQPVGDSENLLRARGAAPEEPILTTEPGDIWPGPPQQAPTMEDLVSDQNMITQPELPKPGTPLSRGTAPSQSDMPGAAGLPYQPPEQPSGAALPSADQSAPPAPAPTDTKPHGHAASVSGPKGYTKADPAGGGQSIVVPNGNGTSTVIHADGRIETIPTPK